MEATCCWPFGVDHSLGRIVATWPDLSIGSVPVGYPLPYVSQHVVQRVSVWLLPTDFMRPAAAISSVPGDLIQQRVSFSGNPAPPTPIPLPSAAASPPAHRRSLRRPTRQYLRATDRPGSCCDRCPSPVCTRPELRVSGQSKNLGLALRNASVARYPGIPLYRHLGSARQQRLSSPYETWPVESKRTSGRLLGWPFLCPLRTAPFVRRLAGLRRRKSRRPGSLSRVACFVLDEERRVFFHFPRYSSTGISGR